MVNNRMETVLTMMLSGIGGALVTWFWTVRKENRLMKSAVATYYASLTSGSGTHPLDSNDFKLMLISLRENSYIDQAYRLEELARLAPVEQAWDTTKIRAYMDQLLRKRF